MEKRSAVEYRICIRRYSGLSSRSKDEMEPSCLCLKIEAFFIMHN